MALSIPSAVLIGLSGAVVLACVFLMGFIHWYKDRAVVKLLSFTGFVYFGVALVALAVIFYNLALSGETCMLAVALFNIGFTLGWGSLFQMLLRMYRIFGTKNIRIVIIPNASLFVRVASFTLVDIIIVVIWAIWWPYRLEEERCKSDQETVFIIVFTAIKGLHLLFGAWLATRVRKLPLSQHGVMPHHLYAIYEILLSSLLFVAVLIPLDLRPGLQMHAVSSLILLCVISVTVTISLPFRNIHDRDFVRRLTGIGNALSPPYQHRDSFTSQQQQQHHRQSLMRKLGSECALEG